MYPSKKNKYGDQSLSAGAAQRHSGALFLVYRDPLRLTHFRMAELFYLPENGYAVRQILHQCSLEYVICIQFELYIEIRSRLVVTNRGNGYVEKSQRPNKSYKL